MTRITVKLHLPSPGRLSDQTGDHRRNKRAGQIGPGATSQDHQEAPGTRRLGQGDNPICHPLEGRPTETDVSIVSLVRVEAEVPHQELWMESLDSVRNLPLQERKVRSIHGLAISGAWKRQVNLRAVRRLEGPPTDAQMENGRIVPNEIAGSIPVVGVGIHDGDSPERSRAPHLRHRDHDIVEAMHRERRGSLPVAGLQSDSSAG